MRISLRLNATDVRKMNEELRKFTFSRDTAETAAAVLESQVRQRIEAGGPAPDGRAWAELSPAYARWKERTKGRLEGGGIGLLRLHGPLLDSLEGRATGQRLTRRAEVLAPVIYARAHQRGNAARGLPARPFLGLSAQDKVELIEVLLDQAIEDLDNQVG